MLHDLLDICFGAGSRVFAFARSIQLKEPVLLLIGHCHCLTVNHSSQNRTLNRDRTRKRRRTIRDLLNPASLAMPSMLVFNTASSLKISFPLLILSRATRPNPFPGIGSISNNGLPGKYCELIARLSVEARSMIFFSLFFFSFASSFLRLLRTVWRAAADGGDIGRVAEDWEDI